MSRASIPLKQATKITFLGFLAGLVAAGTLMLLSRIAVELQSGFLDRVLQPSSSILWPTASATLGGSSNSASEEYVKWAVAVLLNGLVYACATACLYGVATFLRARKS